jgi:hypothetical protein
MIKAGTLPVLLPEENPLADWSAQLFLADRTQYILLSNTNSLYTTVIFGKGVTSDIGFIERALSSICTFRDFPTISHEHSSRDVVLAARW